LVDLLPRFTSQLEAKELQLKVLLPERPLRLMITANHLQRIFQNLLENAIRHSPQGGTIIIEAEEPGGEAKKHTDQKSIEELKSKGATKEHEGKAHRVIEHEEKVHISKEHEGQKKLLRITVRDSGEGVPAGEELRIFERFYRSDRARSRESGGAGLGLAIAKLLVEQHDGQIGVQTADGQGSIFWFMVWEMTGRMEA